MCIYHRTTTYIDPMSAWYDNRNKLEVVNLKIWGQLKVHSVTNQLLLCDVMCLGSC